jgi:uncharacterized membrane protein YqhA
MVSILKMHWPFPTYEGACIRLLLEEINIWHELMNSLLLLCSSPLLLHQHALLKLQVLHQATPTISTKETLATTIVAAVVGNTNLLLLATAVLLAMTGVGRWKLLISH